MQNPSPIKEEFTKQSNNNSDEDNAKQKKLIIIVISLIILLLCCAVIGGAILILSKQEKTADEEKPITEDTIQSSETTTEEISGTTTKTSPSTTSPDSTQSWKTYRSENFGYTLKYPKDWVLDESDKISCVNSPEPCYTRSKGEKVEIYKKNGKNKLSIEYPVGFASYAFDRNKNYKEISFNFWNKDMKKGFVYCNKNNPPMNCIKSKYENIVFTTYHDGLNEKAQDCSTCYYPEGQLKDNCKNNLNIIARFYGGYSKSEDQIFDQIIQSMTKPVCGE